MAATPMIRPQYDPHFDMGTPAIISYWAAFIGERQSMFEKTMEARLKQMDPAALSREVRDANKHIAALMKQRSEMISGAQGDFGNIVKVTVSGEASKESAAIAGASREAVAKIRAGVDYSELESEERAAIAEIDNLTTESYDRLDRFSKDVAASGGNDDAVKLLTTAVVADLIAENGVAPGSPQADAITKNVGIHLEKAATAQGASAAQREAGAWGAEHYPGKDVYEWWEDKHGPQSREAIDQRRARTLGLGSERYRGAPDPTGIFFGTAGAPAAPGAPGAQPGVSGQPGYGAPGGVQPTPGASFQQAAPVSGSPFERQWSEYERVILGPSLERLDEEIEAEKARRDALVEQRRGRTSGGGAGLFDGYGYNYLLESQFKVPARGSRGRLGRLQKQVDKMQRMDPVEREHMVVQTHRSGSAKKAAEAMTAEFRLDPGEARVLPSPGYDLDVAGEEDRVAGLQGIYAWLYDETVAVRAMLGDPEKTVEAGQRLLALQDQAAALLAMDESLGEQNGALFDNLARAIDHYKLAITGDTKLAYDTEGTYEYGQNADGTLYAVTIDDRGNRTGQWEAVTDPGAITAIEDMIGKHPAKFDKPASRAAVSSMLGVSASASNQAAKNDRYFVDVAAAALDEANGMPPEQAMPRIYEIAAATDKVPPAVRGGYGAGLLENVRKNVVSGDGAALQRDTKVLANRGRELAEIERTNEPQEEKEAFRDRLQEQEDARYQESEGTRAAAQQVAGDYMDEFMKASSKEAYFRSQMQPTLDELEKVKLEDDRMMRWVETAERIPGQSIDDLLNGQRGTPWTTEPAEDVNMTLMQRRATNLKRIAELEDKADALTGQADVYGVATAGFARKHDQASRLSVWAKVGGPSDTAGVPSGPSTTAPAPAAKNVYGLDDFDAAGVQPKKQGAAPVAAPATPMTGDEQTALEASELQDQHTAHLKTLEDLNRRITESYDQDQIDSLEAQRKHLMDSIALLEKAGVTPAPPAPPPPPKPPVTIEWDPTVQQTSPLDRAAAPPSPTPAPALAPTPVPAPAPSGSAIPAAWAGLPDDWNELASSTPLRRESTARALEAAGDIDRAKALRDYDAA